MLCDLVEHHDATREHVGVGRRDALHEPYTRRERERKGGGAGTSRHRTSVVCLQEPMPKREKFELPADDQEERHDSVRLSGEMEREQGKKRGAGGLPCTHPDNLLVKAGKLRRKVFIEHRLYHHHQLLAV